jgi:ferredoxin
VSDWKIVVDYDECEANAVCVGILPAVFDVDDDDNLWVHPENLTPQLHDKVREAVASCPKRALAFVEVDA